MAAESGRNLVINKNATAIAGVRAKTITTGNEAIDISTDDELGWRTLLTNPGQRTFDISIEGVTKDTVLRAAAFGANLLLTDITVDFPDGATLSGDFYFNNYEESGNYNDAVTFSASLQSSGVITYTPAP